MIAWRWPGHEITSVLLILDESTTCLTEREAGRLFELIRRLRDQGLTCIFVSHRLREVEELADRVTVLQDGAVVAEFDRSQFSADQIVEAMIGRRLVNMPRDAGHCCCGRRRR